MYLPFGLDGALTGQDLDRLRSADPFHFRPELLVRADLGGHIQNNGKIARFLQPQPHLGLAALAREELVQRLGLVQRSR